MRIYIDMDDTLCYYTHAKWVHRKTHQFPQSVDGFFENLEPIEGAIDAVNELRKLADVYILTAPSIKNPSSYSGKRIWIEKHFDEEFCKKLIISPNKGLLKGDLLIDNILEGYGQESFEGRLLKFGFGPYLTWDSVLEDVKALIKNLKK